MEKFTAHYPLAQILTQMATVDDLNLTVSARDGVRGAGMSHADALLAVKRLTPKQFYKSMTTHADHRVWQDVYHGQHQGIALYIKIQQADEYFVVSFKER